MFSNPAIRKSYPQTGPEKLFHYALGLLLEFLTSGRQLRGDELIVLCDLPARVCLAEQIVALSCTGVPTLLQ